MRLQVDLNKRLYSYMEYTFLNKKTKKIESHSMKFADYDTFKLNNPQLERYHESAPRIASSRGGEHLDSKTDNTWKEVLSKVGEAHPGSPLADKYNRKSVKEVKTKSVVEKHVKKAQQAGRI